MNEVKLNRTFTYIEPGPVLLVTTRDPNTSKPNVMTMGFHMMVRHEPPTVAFVLGPWDYSHDILLGTGECVLSVPGESLAKTVVDIGNCSGDEVDKFEKFQLTPKCGDVVNAPLIEECLANFECKVTDTTMLKKQGMFICEVVKAWEGKKEPMIHHIGSGRFSVDSDKIIDYSDRMTKWKDLPK